MRRCDGIGRRAGLKIWWGSHPVSVRPRPPANFNSYFGVFFYYLCPLCKCLVFSSRKNIISILADLILFLFDNYIFMKTFITLLFLLMLLVSGVDIIDTFHKIDKIFSVSSEFTTQK